MNAFSHPEARQAFELGLQPVIALRFQHDGVPGRGGGAVHPYAVVALISKGRSRIRHTGELELKAGDVHVIPPGDRHSSDHYEHAAGWVLAFWPERSPHAFKLLSRVRHGCHPVFHPTRAQLARLERWMKAIEAEAAGTAAGRNDALAALLQLVLIELDRVSPSVSDSTDASSLSQRALEHIEQHALGPLSLTDVARAVARTPAHVANVVREETGQTVGEWILTQRMAQARLRLRDTDASTEEVARQVGYGDVTHFIRQFRRVHGTTPAKWKRSERTRRALPRSSRA